MSNFDMDAEALLGETEWVRRLARRLVSDAQGAEDVAQDVLVAALERRGGTGDRLQNPRAWLGRVTRNLAIRQLDRREQRAHHEERAARPEELAPGASSLERMQMHQLVVAAVNELEEPYRTAIAMRFYDDLNSRQIAARLGEQPAAVRKRISRGVEALRARLDQDFGGDRQAWCTGLVALAGPRSAALGTKGFIGTGVATMAVAKWTAGLAGVALAAFGGLRMADDRQELPTPLGVEAKSEGPDLELVEITPTQGREPAKDARVESSAGAGTGQVLVSVQHRSGAPAAGARLISLDPNGTVLQAERLDARGRASGTVELRDGGRLGVLGATPAPHWVAISAAEWEGDEPIMRVELPPGDVVSGRIWIDGSPPTEAFELGLRGQSPRESRVDAVLEPLLVDHLERLGDRIVPGQLVRPTGEFRFSALAEGAAARFRIPAGYRLDRGQSLDVSGGAADRNLRLVRVVVIRGRALRADGSVASSLDFDYESTSTAEGGATEVSTGSGRARADGVFEIEAFQRSTEFRLTLRDGVGGVRRLVLDGPDLWPLEQRRNVELGDVVLGERDQIHLVIVDGAGEPVPGATVVSPQESEREGGPAASDGSIAIGDLTDAAVELDVRAFGFREQRIQRPFGTRSNDPRLVVLEPDAVLTVRATAGPGVANEELEDHMFLVALEADEPILRGGWSAPDWLRWSSGNRGVASSPEGWGRMTLGPKEGELRLSGLVPEVPFAVELRDGTGFLLGLQHSAGRGATGATIDFEVERSPRTLRGRVVDESGKALPNVDVRAVAPDEEKVTGMVVHSDADGAFELSGLFGDVLDLEFRKQGFVSVRAADWPISGGQRNWVLEQAVTLEVTAVADDGGPLTIERVEVYGVDSKPGESPIAVVDPSSWYVLGGAIDTRAPEDATVVPVQVQGVPRTPVRLRVLVGGREYERDHDGREPSVVIRVPAQPDSE